MSADKTGVVRRLAIPALLFINSALWLVAKDSWAAAGAFAMSSFYLLISLYVLAEKS